VDGNRKGVFTRDRKPKAAAHALRARWTGLGGTKPSGNDAAILLNEQTEIHPVPALEGAK
jgi:beta-glucuronidase